MKNFINYSLFLLLLCAGTSTFGQEKVLQLQHQEREVTRTIKENKRVRVKTTDGQKFKGRLVIVDANTISIKGKVIALNDIEKIKRDPLLLNLMATSGFVYLGALTVGVGAIVAIFIDGTSAIPFFVGGGGLAALGILQPSYIPARKMANGWSLSISELETSPSSTN